MKIRATAVDPEKFILLCVRGNSGLLIGSFELAFRLSLPFAFRDSCGVAEHVLYLPVQCLTSEGGE